MEHVHNLWRLCLLKLFYSIVCYCVEHDHLNFMRSFLKLLLWGYGYTVNVVIFRWGKISQKYWQGISRGGNFHDTTHISFIKAYGFYFRMGVIFAKKTIARKTRKLSPRENFHVYSIQWVKIVCM